jgi:hypothetical protein
MKKSSSNCQIHGYTEDIVQKTHRRFACKICEYRRHKEWRQKEENRLKRIQWNHRYAEAHPEKIQKFVLKYKLERLENKKRNLIKKIMEPSVKCSKHGLTKDVRKVCGKRKSGIPIYRCRLCHNDERRNYARRKKENSSGGMLLNG